MKTYTAIDWLKMYNKAKDCDNDPEDKVCGQCIRCLTEWKDMAQVKIERYKKIIEENAWQDFRGDSRCIDCGANEPGPHLSTCEVFTEEGEVK